MGSDVVVEALKATTKLGLEHRGKQVKSFLDHLNAGLEKGSAKVRTRLSERKKPGQST